VLLFELYYESVIEGTSAPPHPVVETDVDGGEASAELPDTNEQGHGANPGVVARNEEVSKYIRYTFTYIDLASNFLLKSIPSLHRRYLNFLSIRDMQSA